VEEASSIEVFLSTMSSSDNGLPAKVIGHDALTDTALIQLTQLPKQPLTESKFGDSDQMQPGDWVMAIGNPFRLSGTVTVGVVSAVGRMTPGDGVRPEEMIQTDAAINRGNSGGPLLNLRGEVIGINSQIVTDGALGGGGNVGVGFAIPINTVRDLLPQLRTGKVAHGQIGVVINDKSISPDDATELGLPNTGGAEVSTVQDGPAKAAGMRAADVIVEFNGHAVRSYNDLVRLVTGTTPGTTVPVKVIRDKKALTLNVKVGELDAAKEAAANAAPGTNTSFGLLLQDLAPRDQRRLQLPADRTGAIVTDVTPGSPAEQAGLQEDDVVLSVQNQPVHTAAEASRALGAVPAGRSARVLIWRNGTETLVVVRRQ
jgi:serine protease Do